MYMSPETLTPLLGRERHVSVVPKLEGTLWCIELLSTLQDLLADIHGRKNHDLKLNASFVDAINETFV